MMSSFEKTKASVCPIEEIAAYLDGELDSGRETEIERHLALCSACSAELNLQKRFLCDVSSGLKLDGEIDLPPDFAKKIAVKAESSVSGLRRPHERFNAVFICFSLALFAMFALGIEAETLWNLANGVVEETLAVSAFFGRLVYSFFLGVAIVLRTLALQAGSVLATAILLTLICVMIAFRFRHKVVRLLRV